MKINKRSMMVAMFLLYPHQETLILKRETGVKKSINYVRLTAPFSFLVEEVLVVVEEVQQAEKEEVQQHLEEEMEIKATEISEQSPPTLQKHDTKVTISPVYLSQPSAPGHMFLSHTHQLY